MTHASQSVHHRVCIKMMTGQEKKGTVWHMNTIRATLSEMGRLTMNQAPRVQAAAQQARLRNRTRTARAYDHVGGRIQSQINRYSLG